MTLLYIYRGSDYIYDIIFENYGSIADVTSYEDNGSISASGTYENFGYVTPPKGPWAPSQYYNYGSVVGVADYEDYGSITGTVVYGSRTGQGDGTSSDYGFILDSLSANVEFIGSLNETRRSSEVGSGSLSALSGSAVAFGANPAESILLGTLSGASLEKKISKEIGSGSINISGSSLNSDLSREVGFGTLSAVSGSAESKTVSYNQSSIANDADYGSIGSVVTEFADYGNLGSILEASDFGLLSSTKNPFGLFNISVDKVEKKSYNYNEFSIVFYDGTEDYGSIGVSTSYEDNGSIVNFGPYDDFGTIAGLRNETVYPYGTISLSGTASEEFNGAKIHQGSGLSLIHI